MKICQVGAKFFHAGGQTMKKLIVAFRNFAKSAPKRTKKTGRRTTVAPVTKVIKERKGLWNLRQKWYEANVRLCGHRRRCVPVDSTAYTDGGHATASLLKDSLRTRKSASGSRIPLHILRKWIRIHVNAGDAARLETSTSVCSLWVASSRHWHIRAQTANTNLLVEE